MKPRSAGQNAGRYPSAVIFMPVLLDTDWLPGPWRVKSTPA